MELNFNWTAISEPSPSRVFSTLRFSPGVMRVMTSTDSLSRELRANSAFGLLLSEDERAQALRSARASRRSGRTAELTEDS